MDQRLQPLFTPWKIGNCEIKNRIVMCPMGGTSLFGWFELGGCHFDKEAAKLFLERANNNVGLIIPGIAPLRDTFWGKWLWQNPKMFEELMELGYMKKGDAAVYAMELYSPFFMCNTLEDNDGELREQLKKHIEVFKNTVMVEK